MLVPKAWEAVAMVLGPSAVPRALCLWHRKVSAILWPRRLQEARLVLHWLCQQQRTLMESEGG